MTSMPLRPAVRFSIPVLLSVMVHAGLAFWLLQHSSLSREPMIAPSLSIAFAPPQAPPAAPTMASPAEPRPQTQKSAPREPAPPPQSDAVVKDSKHRVPETKQTSRAQARTPAESSFEPPFLGAQEQATQSPDNEAARQQAQAALRSDVVEYLNNAFRHRFVYPQQARRRGWQGRVLVHIHINRDGQLQDIEVAESSGYAILDRDAVRTFKRIGRLAPRLSARLGHNSRYAIPVIYRLTRG